MENQEKDAEGESKGVWTHSRNIKTSMRQVTEFDKKWVSDYFY